MGTRMADIEVGSEWAVGSEAITRAVQARVDEPGFLERYGLDDDAWIHARGPKGPWQSLVALVDPAHALARLIVLDGTDADIRDPLVRLLPRAGRRAGRPGGVQVADGRRTDRGHRPGPPRRARRAPLGTGVPMAGLDRRTRVFDVPVWSPVATPATTRNSDGSSREGS